jgi:putative tryptophan/tyrosine transport system substrate-binding protein
MLPYPAGHFSMRSFGLGSILLVSLLAIAGCGTKPATKSIAVTQIVEHPSLDAVRDSLKAELAAAGYEADKTLKWQWQSAQGNPATAAQIARKFVGEAPDVIVAISTPSAQALAAATPQIPLIFSAVTDPVGAKLVVNLDKPSGNVTGVSALTPIGQHLDLIAKITPQAKRIGVIYNAGEANSVTLVKLLKEEAPQRKMIIEEVTIANSSGISAAAQSLIGKIDAIYIPTDNTVASALESVLQVGIKNQIPVYAGDNDSVERGAIASVSFDYAEIGKETARLVLRVFKGEKPGEISVVVPQKLELHVNAKSAATMGVKVPEKVLQEAAKVIE